MRGRRGDGFEAGAEIGRNPTRRELVGGALRAVLLLELSGRIGDGAPAAADTSGAGAASELLPFVDEGSEWREIFGLDDREPGKPLRYGSGLGGRQIFDLATLDSRRLAVTTDEFFVRTFRPEGLARRVDGSLFVGGLVTRPLAIAAREIQRGARRRGEHLVECSGNGREHEFGLIGSAAWEGVEALDLLLRARPRPEAVGVEIAGFDEHQLPSLGSVEGATWFFTRDQLAASGAFFATGMNGAPLTRDHGSPLRLVVPGWYGCAWIKWVTEARWVDAGHPSTSQMREFAGRTHQLGVPELALDFEPATIDPAAMPVRVELRRGARGRELRIAGIVWGGPLRVRRLEIQCGDSAPWEAVRHLSGERNGTPWRFWEHRWRPAGPAAIPRLPLRLRVADPGVRTRRLDDGHYVRSVAIPEE